MTNTTNQVTVTASIWTTTGSGHFPRPGKVVRREVFTLPREECEEVRPDWGVYKPTLTNTAAIRALRGRGLLPTPGAGEQVFVGVRG